MIETSSTTENAVPLYDNSWATALCCLALSLVALIIAFFNTFASMVLTWWHSETFAHGFLVIPIVVYLIWNKRSSLRMMLPTPRKSAVLIVPVLIFTWFSAHMLNILIVMQFSVVALVVVFVWMFLGDKIAAYLSFPLGYLFFAVPFGDFLIPILQDLTATFVVKVLQLISIPVYLEGRYFYIPSGSFEVAESCSGVRYLIASICLGTLYSYFTFRSIWRRTIFIAFCIIVPIVANAIRAFGIVMIAHLSNYNYAVGVDHIIYGWIFFGFVIFVLFWVGSYFSDRYDEQSQLTSSVPKRPAVNIQEIVWQDANSKKSVHVSLAMTTILLMIGSSLVSGWWNSSTDNMASIELQFPKGQAGWDGPRYINNVWRPEFVGAAFERLVRYTAGNKEVDAYIGYYTRQKQGAELISMHNKLINENWRRISDAKITIDVAGFSKWKIHEVVTATDKEKRIIWYWYDIGGYQTNSSVAAKLMELPARALQNNTGSAVIAVSTSYDLEANSGRRIIVEFLNNMLIPLQTTVKHGEIKVVEPNYNEN